MLRHDFGDFNVNALPDIHVLEPCYRGGKVVDEDIEGTAAEIRPVDENEILLDALIIAQDIADGLDDCLHGFRGGLIGDANHLLDPAFRHA